MQCQEPFHQDQKCVFSPDSIQDCKNWPIEINLRPWYKHFTSSGCRNFITLCVLNPIQRLKMEDPHEGEDVDN